MFRHFYTAVIFSIATLTVTTCSASASAAFLNCRIEGTTNIQLVGNEQVGSLQGMIRRHVVFGRINMGHARGTVGTLPLDLMVSQDTREDYRVNGWIGGTYVSWRSSGRWFIGEYACLN